ncbi:uncharacterized protein LOC126371610 [Pectinophora gossypiella]|uniref:uncharacterized protein LOC126371610 n=1 Tax=Pectinophora gossypiella TaxID=13191 RepID=UPI00214E21F5|nr:uncharacterized protein LOC126371610 [Pectinophora gossypiella]
MHHFVAILFWTALLVKGQRWYSATFESEPQNARYESPKVVLQINHTKYNDLRYLPLTAVNITHDTRKDKWGFLKKYDVAATVSQPQTYKKVSKFNLTRNHFGSGPKYQFPKRTDKFSFDDAIPPKRMQNTSEKFATPVFKFDKVIHNINVIKKTKPKGKIVRRCPTVRPRIKKQLNSNSNQTLQKRFLEVFEVVEFDHDACVSSSGLEGTCLPEFDCQTSGGLPMGSCADGYGTCCVTQFSCDGRSAVSSGWFVNPGFPSPSTDRLSCVFTLDKASVDIKQIRLDFNNFELLPPNAGTCEQDQFVVSGQNVNNIIPILCGVNSGQHVYIEVGDSEGPITLSVQTVSSDSRLFSIKVTQLTSTDELAAPSGCLQYFKGSLGYLESFNFRDKSDIAIARSPSYLNNLNYAICIERVTDTCSVTYTNTGDMQIVNYDSDGLPVIPPGQAGVEIFNCPTDWLLIAAVRLCGERLNDGSVLQDFALDAPVTDVGVGPIVVWFKSDGGYVGRGFRVQYQQNNC